MKNQIQPIVQLSFMAESVFHLVHAIWWSIIPGIVTIGVLGKIPREFVIFILGRPGGPGGVIRATLAGLLLDLCSHGILMVGAKLYERGASIGQVMAFLISSPWNSFSLTLILFALMGLPWVLAFIILSMLIAVITGVLFEKLVASKVIAKNPYTMELPANFRFGEEAKKRFQNIQWSWSFIMGTLLDGIKSSRVVIRWLLFGIVLASIVRAFMDPESFQTYFGPTLLGLGLTLLVTTLLEVCSEGSAPLAADLMTRGNAPGNSFAFLMGGVSTDYTEIMVLKDTIGSWKTALFLPILTLPQIILIAWIINHIQI